MYFAEENFKYGKNYGNWTGPRLLSEPGKENTYSSWKCLGRKGPIALIFKRKFWPKTYIGSMIVTCDNAKPHCAKLMDRWEDVGVFDNTQSSDEGEFTLTHKTGVTLESEQQVSLEKSTEVEVHAFAKKILGIFSLKGSISGGTGYNWTKSSTRTHDDAIEYNVDIKVPPKQRLVVQQVVGHCDGSTVHAELFRSFTFTSKYSGSTEKDARKGD